MDGAADLFLQHGFTRLYGTVCTLGQTDPCWIGIDVYDMGKAANTLSLFHSRMTGEPVMLDRCDIACEGPGFLLAGAGRYYLEIQSLGTPCPALPLFRSLAADLARMLPP